jgi:hypothetical protein
MIKEQLLRWFYLMELDTFKMIDKQDYQELIRLNRRVMQKANNVHNNNMLREG